MLFIVDLEKIRRSRATGMSAVATSRFQAESKANLFAIGYLNGEIKIRQLNKDLKVLHHFNTPQSSVMDLDFNCTNENVASTHENGSVNIYSLLTAVKYDTIKIDGASTLSRFHPSKRSVLGIASLQGTATLFDIFAKKPIFKNIGAHGAPCSDIAFTEQYMLTCGYDSVINIFDTRRQSSAALNIKSTYGFTTIAMSEMGAYFVCGNMKGELISYDMRNIKKPLTSARVESGGHKISKVDFLRKGAANTDEFSWINMAVRNSLEAAEKELIEGPVEPVNNDSFIEDLVGFQRGRISDFSSSIVNHGTRLSTGSSFSEFEHKQIDDFEEESPVNDVFVNKGRRGSTSTTFSKRRSSLLPPNLQHISEENDKENDPKLLNTPRRDAKPRSSSTPAIKVSNDNEDVIDAEESFKSVEDSSKQRKSMESTSGNFDLSKEFEKLEKSLSEKIRIEVGMLNFDEENRYIKVMSQVYEQRQRLQERVNMIEECMGMLLNDDFKMNRIMELEAENAELKKQNLELLRHVRN